MTLKCVKNRLESQEAHVLLSNNKKNEKRILVNRLIVSFYCLVMAYRKSTTNNTTTVALYREEAEVLESTTLVSLRRASALVCAVVTEGCLGYLDNPERLGDEFLATAYEQINDANQELLRLGVEDSQGLQSVFESYVNASTFLTSSLLGHLTTPVTVPATFFGRWSLVGRYHEAHPSVPWYVIAVAVAWLRCAFSMWTQFPGNEHLAQEVRTTLSELASASGNESLIERLRGTSDVDLVHYVDHLIGGNEPRDDTDEHLRKPLEWALGRVKAHVTANELELVIQSQKRLFEQLSKSTVAPKSTDAFVGLEFIGPMRLIARVSPTGIVPTEVMHQDALDQLHGRVLEAMKHSIGATEAARETNEMVAAYREETWKGKTGMMPATRRGANVTYSEYAPSYQPSTLQGSLANERSDDFLDEEDLDGNKDSNYDDEENDSFDDDLEENERGEEEEEDDHVLATAVEERRRLFAMHAAVGLVPVRRDFEPLDMDDSRSSYAASSLSGFSNSWPVREPSVPGSVISGHSFTAPLQQAINIRSQDSGLAMMPVEHVTEAIAFQEDNGSGYAPSVLSQWSDNTQARPTVVGTVPARRESIRDAASSVASFGRAPSMRSKFSSVSRHARSLLPPVNEEQMEGQVETVPPDSSSNADIVQWATDASAITHQGDTLLQEGSAANALLEDNVTLGQHLAVHQSGETGLVSMLTQAHKELGEAHASLNAKDQSIAQLNEALREEKIIHTREIERLQSDLAAAQRQIENMRKNAAETSSFIDQIQNENAQSMAKLREHLTLKTREVETLQKLSEDLNRTIQEQTSHLSNLQLQLQESSQRKRNTDADLERWRLRVNELEEQVTQRDAVVVELKSTVAQYEEAGSALETKREQIEAERRKLQMQLQELQLAREHEMATAKKALDELSIQNKDLSDSLQRTTSEMANLKRAVDSDKRQDRLVMETRDNELIEIQEQYRRMETALSEAQLEADEAQRAVSETRAAISRLGQTTGVSPEATSSETMERFVDRICQQLEVDKEKTNQAVLGLAAATGVPLSETKVRNETTSTVLKEIGEAVSFLQAQKEQATRESLVGLVKKSGGKMNAPASTRDLIENIQGNIERIAEENRTIRDGLSKLAEVTTTKVSSIDLILRAQQRFRSLEALANDSRNEVSSLRQRMERVQGELERERDDHKRQDAVNQQKIADLQEILRRLQEQISHLEDQVKRSDSEVQQCQLRLAESESGLKNAIAANRQATETLSTREAECRKQLKLASDESERAEQQVEDLRRRMNELQQASDNNENDVGRLRAECESREEIARRQSQDKERQLHALSQEYQQLVVQYENALKESRQATETLSLREVEWNRQLVEINTELRLAEEETRDLRRRVEESERDSEVLKKENETQKLTNRQLVELKESELSALRREHARLEEELNRQRTPVGRQLDQDERMSLRFERDNLVRKVADLELEMRQRQDNEVEYDRLNALNEQLTIQLREFQDERAARDNLIAELKAQVATLEALIMEMRQPPKREEMGLIDDDVFEIEPSTPVSPDLEGDQERLDELGQLLAQREYELVKLDNQVSDRRAELDTLIADIEDAEATLSDLYIQIASVHRESPPFEQNPEPELPEDDPQPSSSEPLRPVVPLHEFKQRFASIKPTLKESNARRWVLGVGGAEAHALTYDAAKHDSLLDPCMQFAYREEVDALLLQTLAFVTTLGGASPEMRKRRSAIFRGLDNLQRLAMEAKRFKGLDGFRLGTVCELIVPLTDNVRYEGAVVRRYCEFVLEMAMAITLQWRDSVMQQTRRLIFTEGGLHPNDPTAIVVRFLASPFQPFDRCQLVEAIANQLVRADIGWTIEVPVDARAPAWTPRESILRDFDEPVPSHAPIEWIAQHLDMASSLVPGLVHVLPGQALGRMDGDGTYVQIARLDQTGYNDMEIVLLVGQLDTWVVIDPLYSEDDHDAGGDGRQMGGVLRAPHAVTRKTDSGFALMTWIREVLVHGMAMDNVEFRGQPDRERCTLEHHLKCLFHS